MVCCVRLLSDSVRICTAQSLHVVAAANNSAVLPWLRLVFANQDRYLNDGGLETPSAVKASLDSLAVAGQILPKGAMLRGLARQFADQERAAYEREARDPGSTHPICALPGCLAA